MAAITMKNTVIRICAHYNLGLHSLLGDSVYGIKKVVISMEQWVNQLLQFLSISQVGLSAVFIVCFISATLLPLGSEPLVFAVAKMNPDMFWVILFVATLGNTLGGMVNYGMGYFAKNTFAKEKQTRWFGWLEKYGAKTMLLTWLPLIGDPMCVVGGWLKLPVMPSMLYMAVGKFLRYLIMTSLLLYLPDSFWHSMAGLLG